MWIGAEGAGTCRKSPVDHAAATKDAVLYITRIGEGLCEQWTAGGGELDRHFFLRGIPGELYIMPLPILDIGTQHLWS